MEKETLKTNTANGSKVDILIGDASNGYNKGEIADVNAIMSITNLLPVLDITDLSKYGELFEYDTLDYNANSTTFFNVSSYKCFDVTDIFKKKFGTIDSLPSLCIIKMGLTVFPFYYSATWDWSEYDEDEINPNDKISGIGYFQTVSCYNVGNVANGIIFGIEFYYLKDSIIMYIRNDPFELNSGGINPAIARRSTTNTTNTETDTPSIEDL